MKTPDRTRALAAGLMTGFVLSVARAPLGLGLAGIPAALPGDTFLFRGLGLLLVAFAIARLGTHAIAVVPLLGGLTLGFGLHGLFVGERFALDGRGELYGLWLVAALVLAVAYRKKPTVQALDASEEEPRGASLVERAALLLVGAGLVLTFEAIARPLRLLGGGLPAAESLQATLFLALTTFGAAAFGPLVPRAVGGAGAAFLLVASGLACFFALEPLARFSTRDGLEPFLRSQPWDLDVSLAHMHGGLALIGARVLFAPAFLLGTALFATRERSRLVWVTIGAGIATLVLPSLLELGIDAGEEGVAASAAGLRVVKGLMLAGVGGLVAVASTRSAGLPLRAALLLGTVGIVAFGMLRERPKVLPLSPWEKHPVIPELTIDTVAGLITVDRTLDLGRVATLDRRWVSPSPTQEAADEARLRTAWERVVDPAGAGTERRVLLVGQLTPGRARVLQNLGATHVDRTAAWHGEMDRLERLLFEDVERPPGRILAPSELEERAPWSLVVVPPISGGAARVAPPDDALGPVVVWVSAESGVAETDWGGLVRLASDGVSDLSIAIHQPQGIPCGDAAAATSPWSRLSERPFERTATNLRRAMRRLADGAKGSGHENLTEGLALHYAAQERSSPFEPYSQAIEIDDEALARLRDAALLNEPSPYLRRLWNGLAGILAEKREIEALYEHLEPLAAKYEPWWELELALMRADLESLDPESAATRVAIVVAARPLDISLRLLAADTLSMAQRPMDAVAQLREADGMQPGRRDVRRRMAMALARAGSDEAQALVAELLAEDPTDEELRPFASPGPYPPVEVEFSPLGMEALDEHDH